MPAEAMAPRMLRLTCTYTPGPGQALTITVVAGVLLDQQLIELQHDCGIVWERPGVMEPLPHTLTSVKSSRTGTSHRVITLSSPVST
jgi:hypothetical protein